MPIDPFLPSEKFQFYPYLKLKEKIMIIATHFQLVN